MRKIIVLEHISLDGVIQAPGGPDEDRSDGFAYGGWAAPYHDRDEAIEKALNKMLNMPLDLLLGRKTFEIWGAFWPQHGDIWPNVNTATKYVASNTVTSSEWQPSVFLNGDIAGKVAKLKQEQGPDLHVWGSGNLLQTLMKHDLVDVFWLMIFPLTLGSGKRYVCGWHDPGGLQGDGKHCRLEWRHSRQLRTCRRSSNRNRRSINIRVVWPGPLRVRGVPLMLLADPPINQWAIFNRPLNADSLLSHAFSVKTMRGKNKKMPRHDIAAL